MTRRIGIALALLSAIPAQAYVRMKTAGDTPLTWPSASVTYHLESSVSAGAKNGLGGYVVVPGSDPAAAIQASLDTWNGITNSRARFGTLQQDSPGGLGVFDRVNVIGFANNAQTRSAVAHAIAITGVYYSVLTGEIVDADIILNPQYTFSTKLALDAMDLQSTVTHELGHTWGAAHSPLMSATMYAYGSPESTEARTLSADDIAFITEAYPVRANNTDAGTVKGRIACPGDWCQPAASVYLFDGPKGTLIHTLSTQIGDYTFTQIPPGTYHLFVEPYIAEDELLEDVNPGWAATVYGGPRSPQTIDLTAGATATANLTPPAPKLLTEGFIIGESFSSTSVHSGYTTSFALFASGSMKPVGADDVLFFGSGMKIDAESLDCFTYEDESFISFDIEVPSNSTRTTAVVAVRQDDGIVLAPGIVLLPDMPAAVPSDIVNTASYEPGPIAPGEILGISGYRLGPADGISGSEARNAGVSVKIDGLDTPVLYTSDQNLRIQVPYEISGRESAVLQIRKGEAAAEDILLEVAPANPGIVFPIFNEDGTPNGSRTPAARGSVLTMYGTGQGVVAPAIPTGEKAADASSLISDAKVEIDGVAAEVKAAYMVPGSIGIFRIDVVVPKTIEKGGWLDMRFSIANVANDAFNAVIVK